MSASEYRRENTALLFVDPYNDFLSEGGLAWPRLKEVAEEVGLLENLRAIHAAVRAAGIRIFIVPHRQWEKGDYESWQHVNPTQRRITRSHSFAKGTWGGEFHVISHVVIVGPLANTCIESTARFAMELGYHVTLVRDATAAFTRELMRAVHELNGPTFAHAIVTTKELLSTLPKEEGAASSRGEGG